MKVFKFFMLPLILCLWLPGCSDDKEEIDEEYPEIVLTAPDAFPTQCSTLARGGVFTFKALLRDNIALGSLSVDIHHNFDHHTHSTELEECDMDMVKTPENPFLLIRDFPIPARQREYEASFDIAVPADVDPGDYHFMIRLTDKTGWQTIKGLSIKIK